ncbi:hypothetical protein QFC21_001736 [Naganishia friedmannii]|uniref:Uncharacterized protein n=1 Tax=Naganishia friedmannii TaxID=89922 RepID=A0ACC2W189_9TREE|nr:hypothetical protein QFC21_001736 [Naganishia friedmannii]
MPVVRKKGALFAVYHDSPPPPPPPPAVASASSSAASKPHPHIGKKDVLSSRSPTQRQKTKSVSTCRAPGTGSLKPSQAALVASSALQSLTGTTGSLGGRGKSLGVLSAKTGNTTAAARGGGLRDPLAVKKGVGKEKENLRSLGMMGMSSLSAGGKMTEKMHVFVDPGEQKSTGDVGNKDTRPRTGRVLRDKAISEIRARPHHHHLRQRSSSSIHAIQNAVSTSTVFNETSAPTTGQENTTPAGEIQATTGSQKPSRPTPHRAITTTSTNNRTTLTSAPRRMSTRSARHEPHDSAMEEDAADTPPVEEDPEESPYLSKPRLRKLKPPPSSLLPSPNQQRKMKMMMMMRESTTTTTAEHDVMESMQNQAGSISPQTTHVQVVSSQPQPQSQSEAQEQENLFSSSPLIERPRTRKPTTTTAAATSTSSSSSSFHPKSHHRPTKKNPSAGAAAGTYAVVHADQVLCDVSEAYGADTSLQPYGFQRQSGLNPARGGTYRRERTARNGKERAGGLEPSTYGWAQISRNEFRAPSPPTSSMKRRRAGML